MSFPGSRRLESFVDVFRDYIIAGGYRSEKRQGGSSETSCMWSAVSKVQSGRSLYAKRLVGGPYIVSHL